MSQIVNINIHRLTSAGMRMSGLTFVFHSFQMIEIVLCQTDLQRTMRNNG